MTDDNTLDSDVLNQIKDRLLDRLDYVNKHQAQNSELHSQAIPTDSEEASSILEEIELSEKEGHMEITESQKIAAALKRIDEGCYGKCEGCGDAIGKERLLAIPFAELCIACQSKKESDS